jgi:hypothetical protein
MTYGLTSAKDWVLTLTFDDDSAPDVTPDVADAWEAGLADLDAAVAHIPGQGIDVTVYGDGELSMREVFDRFGSHVAQVVGLEPVGVEIIREPEHMRRAEAPTLPEPEVKEDPTADEIDDWLDSIEPDPKDARDGAHYRRIVAAAEAVDAASSDLDDAVAAARAAGDTWAMIGVALGVSRQAAYQRFGTNPPRPASD